MNDLEMARTVPCPACKMGADQPCVDLDTLAESDGVHENRIYRAYVVAAALAHNRAVELATEVDQLRTRVATLDAVASAAATYVNCPDDLAADAYDDLAAAVIAYERKESP